MPRSLVLVQRLLKGHRDAQQKSPDWNRSMEPLLSSIFPALRWSPHKVESSVEQKTHFACSLDLKKNRRIEKAVGKHCKNRMQIETAVKKNDSTAFRQHNA